MFISKDYSKKVVMVSCVPMIQLDPIKDWLDSCDLKYSEGIQSLNWAKIMKTIQEDPKEFFETGGWSFLDPESESEEIVESEESQSENSYNPEQSGSGSGYESESSDYDEEEEEDYSDGTSDIEDEEPSDALSWDDLEEVARKEDENKALRHRSQYSNASKRQKSSNSNYKRSKY